MFFKVMIPTFLILIAAALVISWEKWKSATSDSEQAEYELNVTSSAVVELSDETLKEVDIAVRNGFLSRDTIVGQLCDRVFGDEVVEEPQAREVVDRALARLGVEMKTWPAMTDCDRLDEVFTDLRATGIICIDHAGYTKSDGYEIFEDCLEASVDQDRVIGYCYYTQQDLEGAIRSRGLMLAFGPRDPRDETIRGPEIGRVIAKRLEAAGFEVAWDGTFETRINIPKFEWKRR